MIRNYSIKETAKTLGISIPTLYKLLDVKGEDKGRESLLKSLVIGDRRVVPHSEIMKFMKEGLEKGKVEVK